MSAAASAAKALRHGLAAGVAAACAASRWQPQPPSAGERRAPAARGPPAAAVRPPALLCEAKSLVFNYSDPKTVANLERYYTKAQVASSRQAVVDLLRPRAGERILDVGCGPGFMLADILREEPALGLAVGVDPSEIMVDMARARAGAASIPGAVEIRVGGAEDLPFPDGTFDAVVFMQVLLYVKDVPKALQEARRVLRPGGRLLLLETDWNGLLVHTLDTERFRRIFAACCSAFVDPHVPPKLPGLLAELGMRVREFRTVNMGTAGGKDYGSIAEDTFMGNWAFTMVPQQARAFGLPESDVDGWLREQRAFCDQGAFFASMHRSVFLAYKPDCRGLRLPQGPCPGL